MDAAFVEEQPPANPVVHHRRAMDVRVTQHTSVDPFRPEAVSDDTRAVNARVVAKLAATPRPADLAANRAAFAAGLTAIPASPRSPRARTLTISGPDGDVPLRIVAPDVVRGVYLHLHGGVWILGTNDMWDDQFERLGRDVGLACVSVDYRLAPEHVFPAAVDDSVAAARWLIGHAEREFSTSVLAIGGESAGAHLAVATLLRLRDEGRAGAFAAANLLYGCYDLSLTPSARRATATPVLNRTSYEAGVAAFRGDVDPTDPALSPLYADLAGLPQALFSVGTLDPLLDDSLFMHMRWRAAGGKSELAVYPGGLHGFDTFGGSLAKEASRAVSNFLSTAIG